MALFDLFGIGQTPDYLSSLMDEEQRKKLQQQATSDAMINFGLNALSQGGYSKVPVGLGQIIGSAGKAGFEGYQNTIQQGAQNLITQQKLAEMKRQNDQQNQLNAMIAKLPEEEQVYARLAPEQWITGKMKPTTKAFSLLNEEQRKAYGLPSAPAGQAWQISEKGFDLVGAANKSNWTPPYTLNGQTVQRNIDTGEIRQAVTQPASTVTNVQNFTPAAQQLQKESASAIVKNYETLQYAPQTIATMEQAKALVPQATSFTGSFGEDKLQIAKFFNNNFGTNIDPTGIQSAEQLRSALFANVMDNLKKMDASPSQQQQAVMAKAFGTLETDPSSLPKIIDIYETAIRNKVDIHNKRVKQIGEKVELPYDLTIELPAATQSGGSTLLDRINQEKARRKQGNKP